MTDKLRDAMDWLQVILDDQTDILWPEGEDELREVLEAAREYWNIAYAEGDPWDE